MEFLRRVNHRLLAPRRSQNFYYKLISYTLLISLLPILIMSIVIYHNAKNTMQQELQVAKQEYLKQTVRAIEMIINQINGSFKQLALDKTIRNFESFPRGSYYEELKGELIEEDLPILGSYLTSKATMSWNLSFLKQSNDFINSIYFYDKWKNVLITSEGLQYTRESFYDKGWDEFSAAGHAFPMFMDLRKARQDDGRLIEVIPIVYRSSVDGNFLVINLDAGLIYQSFVNKLEHKSDNVFFVLSGSGQLMLYDRSSGLSQSVNEDAGLRARLGQASNQASDPTSGPTSNQASAPTSEQASEQTFEGKYEGKRMLVTYMTSDILGWTFISATSLDELYRSVSNIKGIIVLTCFLLVTFTILLALITSKRIYNPIFHLTQYIKNKDQNFSNPEFPSSRSSNELAMIRSSLEEAFEDRVSLQVRLKESVPAYREIFMRSLILKPGSREEIMDRMQFLGLNLALDGLMLMAVALEETDELTSDVEHYNIKKLQIIDMMEAIIPAEHSRLIMEMSDGFFVGIINCDEEAFMEHMLFAEQMIQEAEQLLGLKCSIGIGTYCRDIYELKHAYREAREALRYRSITGLCEVIYIEDVRLEGTPVFVYPKDKETVLNGYLINGETEQALRVFAEITQEIQSQQGKVHYRQIQQAFFQLFGILVTTTSDLRLDLNRILQEKENLYSVLLQKKDVSEVVSWLEEVIGLLSKHIGGAFKEKYNRHVDQVIDILEQDCGSNMSLAVAADKLRITPSYLSRIFKEKTGESFSEYLTRKRIDKSKKLLLETGLKIKEIGDEVGYHKTTYFIKLFKDFTGTTPGEYRKMHIEE
ncbi:helix-turn-helix domain-containing protein [Paenibacillus eucommiae]|uniref:AraC-like DNA-binding protein n=1 Tax=Paenibacillus eucommiae TaxID=1355755 RepID=A0ABS4ILY8_9BACL|nr:helix-turn-helix domain-containing protein [Paenibacillus eucommiae]MBP1988577.1 AraC-like DNA-binding protein [Paenibacillus eucommiae]